MIHAFAHDVRHAVRGYVRVPLFTTIAVMTIALGIGSTTAIFSVVSAVVLRPLPYAGDDRLVELFQVRRDTRTRTAISPPNYFDLKEQSRSFTAMAAYWTPTVTIAGDGADPQKVLAVTTSHELFGILGVTPALGRGLAEDDSAAGARRVAVLGYGLWQRRFGGDPGVLGRTVSVDGSPTLVTGVMPRGFEFPAAGAEMWIPLRLSRTEPPNRGIPAAAYRQYRILSVIARLQPDVSLAAAQREIARLGDALEGAYPDANHAMTATAIPLHDAVVGSVRPALFFLFGAVGCLLLIACANASSLVLVRAAARSRELAVRRALGADRARLAAQMLAETLVLALAGGAVGLLLAAWAVDLFVRLAPPGIPRLETVRVDGTVAAFAFVVSLVIGIVFGIAPALHVGRRSEHDVLRGAGRGAVESANQRTRHALVAIEVALSTILIVGASLLIQSFLRLGAVDTGFQASAAIIVDRVELPRSRDVLTRSGPFFEQLLDRLSATPGIDAAAASLGLPLDPRARFFVDDSTFSIAGHAPLAVAERPVAALHVVTGDYFSAAGIPLKQGRWFDRRDRPGAPGVAIVNEAFARRYFPSESPLDRTITHDLTILPGQTSMRQIVGVVGDVRHFGLDRGVEPQMFVPHLQMPWPAMALVIRTKLPPSRLTTIVSEAVHALDAAIPVPPAKPMEQMVSDATGPTKFRASLVGLFAMTAVALAMIGLYGTMAFAIQQRTRELGLRLALGATPGDAIRLVLSSGLRLAIAGAAAGVVGALAITRLLATMLFGITPTDAPTLVIAPLSLVAMAAIACYLPARRVRHIEPLDALNER